MSGGGAHVPPVKMTVSMASEAMYAEHGRKMLVEPVRTELSLASSWLVMPQNIWSMAPMRARSSNP